MEILVELFILLLYSFKDMHFKPFSFTAETHLKSLDLTPKKKKDWVMEMNGREHLINEIMRTELDAAEPCCYSSKYNLDILIVLTLTITLLTLHVSRLA